MKKLFSIVLTIIMLSLTANVPGYADRDGHGGHGSRGGHTSHGGYAVYGGYGGNVGIDLMIGPWWGYGYPSYPYYPYYTPPAVIIPSQPDVYLQPAPQTEGSDYWYYCRNPEGYYPYVKRCPNGWLKVVPSPPADQEE